MSRVNMALGAIKSVAGPVGGAIAKAGKWALAPLAGAGAYLGIKATSTDENGQNGLFGLLEKFNEGVGGAGVRAAIATGFQRFGALFEYIGAFLHKITGGSMGSGMINFGKSMQTTNPNELVGNPAENPENNVAQNNAALTAAGVTAAAGTGLYAAGKFRGPGPGSGPGTGGGTPNPASPWATNAPAANRPPGAVPIVPRQAANPSMLSRLGSRLFGRFGKIAAVGAATTAGVTAANAGENPETVVEGVASSLTEAFPAADLVRDVASGDVTSENGAIVSGFETAGGIAGVGLTAGFTMAATATGAQLGATAGAAVGVWFGGVGAVPGAAIGGAIGGTAGFVTGVATQGATWAAGTELGGWLGGKVAGLFNREASGEDAPKTGYAHMAQADFVNMGQKYALGG